MRHRRVLPAASMCIGAGLVRYAGVASARSVFSAVTVPSLISIERSDGDDVLHLMDEVVLVEAEGSTEPAGIQPSAVSTIVATNPRDLAGRDLAPGHGCAILRVRRLSGPRSGLRHQDDRTRAAMCEPGCCPAE